MHCSEAAAHSCSSKKVLLKISQNSQKNTCVGVFFHNKVAGIEACNFIKKDSNSGVFLWTFKDFKNSCFYRPEACNFIKKETLTQVFSYEFAKFLRTPFAIQHLRWLLLQ